MTKARIAMVALTTLTFAVESVFEDIPSPFDGWSVSIGPCHQTNAGALTLEDNNGIIHVQLAHPGFLKGRIDASYNFTSGLWLTGFQAGASIGEKKLVFGQSTIGYSNEIYSELQYDLTISAIKGFMPNPSTLLKARIGFGGVFNEYEMKDNILDGGPGRSQKTEYTETFIEGSVSTVVNLLTTWGVEVGIDGRYTFPETVIFQKTDGLDGNEGSLSITSDERISWAATFGIVYQAEVAPE